MGEYVDILCTLRIRKPVAVRIAGTGRPEYRNEVKKEEKEKEKNRNTERRRVRSDKMPIKSGRVFTRPWANLGGRVWSQVIGGNNVSCVGWMMVRTKWMMI